MRRWLIGSDLPAVDSGQKYFHLISRISFSEARIRIQMPETKKRVSETMSDEFDLVRFSKEFIALSLLDELNQTSP